ncbi:hypothetical protein BLTE_08810 [Blastochloris tepida]|uniref:Uncharacterized protein n=1 Tax=Blastochloris tepida TaxID=2233851 RepID=A0A348FY13_9HYPH|nr:hypothetical protein BLTE_08810 [Blastochloris tepida]
MTRAIRQSTVHAAGLRKHRDQGRSVLVRYVTSTERERPAAGPGAGVVAVFAWGRVGRAAGGSPISQFRPGRATRAPSDDGGGPAGRLALATGPFRKGRGGDATPVRNALLGNTLTTPEGAWTADHSKIHGRLNNDQDDRDGRRPRSCFVRACVRRR